MKPIVVGAFGFAVQFSDLDLMLKLAVGFLTVAYVGAKLLLLISRNRVKLLHPISEIKSWFYPDKQ